MEKANCITGRKKKQESVKRVSGKQYVTCKNKSVDEKIPPKDKVSCKCYYQCKALSPEVKTTLFRQFYETDEATQGTFLMGILQVGNIRRRRHGSYDHPENSKRQVSVYYTVPNGSGKHVQVCQQTFREIFCITKKRLENLVKKKKLGYSTYTDLRKNNRRNIKYTEEHSHLIHEHINSFPRSERHYCRKKSTKEYLSPDLNINRLYRAFIQKYPKTNISSKHYRKIFKKDFPHLSFKHPRQDTCKTCDLLNCKVKSGENGAKMKLELHHRKVESALSYMKHDHTISQQVNSETCTIFIDLQQVLFVPTLTHSDMFYMRQLSCYNFCVHVGDTSSAYMCIWHEGIASRGGNEIISCLLKVINSGITSKKNLCIWCDNCTGQNKNRMMIFLFIFMVSVGLFDSVEQKFLISGHSYLPCDRDFAHIEKRKKVTRALVPDDLCKMIREARHDNKFNVVSMELENFLNIQRACDALINTTKLNIKKASWIKIESSNPAVVQIRDTFNEMEAWKRINVLKKRQKIGRCKENRVESHF
ncbi:hypothetical protein NQ314_018649 [Rhamnusium bicolor]|uniref:DUF7869 domain-containing protein n=1 Tax=Rhamnusium bicolor TaxID=1586634 RepID=A0AAV8WRG7_9CUCU|nr:hypothetical protein NQ314_018649 [Rhamnusium bicolor]